MKMWLKVFTEKHTEHITSLYVAFHCKSLISAVIINTGWADHSEENQNCPHSAKSIKNESRPKFTDSN